MNRGVSGDTREPSRVYAARMEAALLWFLYLSADASALRCTTGTNACDAAYAYYTGGVSAFTVPATPDGGVRSDGGVSTDGGTRDGALADSSIDGSMVADASSGDAGADGAVADAASSVDATVDLGTLLDAARDSGMGDAGAPMPILTRGGLGLGRLVRGVDLATHDRVWDGLLAVRCWRDLDRASPATDLTLRDRARAQLNLALTRGIMLILDARLSAFASSAGDSKRAHHAFLRTLLAPIPATSITDDSVVPPRIYAVRGRPSLLDARIRQISASDADFIATEILKPAERVDAGEIAMRLARLFPCS